MVLAIAVLAVLAACSETETEDAPRSAVTPTTAAPAAAPTGHPGPTAASLGLTIDVHRHGLEVTKVETGSPAARSGFRVGDVITSLKQGRPTVNIDTPNPLALERALNGHWAPAVIRFEVIVKGTRRLTIRKIRLR